MSQSKLLAEGILSETQVILGWLIDTRQLKLFITKEKAKRILIELKELIKCAENCTIIKRKLLESIVGKLQDISFIIPKGKFFLNRLRYRLKVVNRSKVAKTRKSTERHAMIAKWALHWDCWLNFCKRVNQSDLFLRNIDSQRGITKVNYFEAFTELYRHNYFSRQLRLPIRSRTISESLGQIGSNFQDNSVENPVKIPYSTHFVRYIHKLLLSYKEVDPPTKRQASLPMCVFKDLLDDKSTALDEAIGELNNRALHFVMRS